MDKNTDTCDKAHGAHCNDHSDHPDKADPHRDEDDSTGHAAREMAHTLRKIESVISSFARYGWKDGLLEKLCILICGCGADFRSGEFD